MFLANCRLRFLLKVFCLGTIQVFDDLYGLFNRIYYKHIIIYYFYHIMSDMHTNLS